MASAERTDIRKGLMKHFRNRLTLGDAELVAMTKYVSNIDLHVVRSDEDYRKAFKSADEIIRVMSV